MVKKTFGFVQKDLTIIKSLPQLEGGFESVVSFRQRMNYIIVFIIKMSKNYKKKKIFFWKTKRERQKDFKQKIIKLLKKIILTTSVGTTILEKRNAFNNDFFFYTIKVYKIKV